MTEDIRTRNLKNAHAFLDHLTVKDMEAWADLLAEEIVQDMPYSPAGFPKRVEGKTALVRHYSNLPASTGRMEFLDRRELLMIDPNEIGLEYRGEIEILATGRRYDNLYLGLFRFDRQGKIVFFREYYDPHVLTAAWAGALDDGFSLSK